MISVGTIIIHKIKDLIRKLATDIKVINISINTLLSVLYSGKCNIYLTFHTSFQDLAYAYSSLVL